MYAYAHTLTESGEPCLFSPFSPSSPGLSQSLFSLWGCPAFLVSCALRALSCLLPTQPSPAPAGSRQCSERRQIEPVGPQSPHGSARASSTSASALQHPSEIDRAAPPFDGGGKERRPHRGWSACTPQPLCADLCVLLPSHGSVLVPDTQRKFSRYQRCPSDAQKTRLDQNGEEDG